MHDWAQGLHLRTGSRTRCQNLERSGWWVTGTMHAWARPVPDTLTLHWTRYTVWAFLSGTCPDRRGRLWVRLPSARKPGPGVKTLASGRLYPTVHPAVPVSALTVFLQQLTLACGALLSLLRSDRCRGPTLGVEASGGFPAGLRPGRCCGTRCRRLCGVSAWLPWGGRSCAPLLASPRLPDLSLGTVSGFWLEFPLAGRRQWGG